ncbi:MAG: hypothetical protein NXI04_22175 [Planctomycetaceae bacterium]|nr:hypothetical protein [Planctomycetaceae bacterium]
MSEVIKGTTAGVLPKRHSQAEHGGPLCGSAASDPDVTTDPERVTCGKCVARMKRNARLPQWG